MRLKDKVAIITGAADIESIGAAISNRYAKEGAKVVIADIVDGNIVVDAVRKASGEAIFVNTDVTKQEQCDAMARVAIDRFGSVDILVNCAAIYATLVEKSFMDVTAEEWNRLMEVNVAGPFRCVKAVFPYMKEKGGKIINIASDSFLLGVPGIPHYVTSKGGIFALTRCLATELGVHRININSLSPGYTKSGASKRVEKQSTLSKEGEFDEFALQVRCLKRAEYPEDLAGAAVFLASADSDYMTGQQIVVNGGMCFY